MDRNRFRKSSLRQLDLARRATINPGQGTYSVVGGNNKDELISEPKANDRRIDNSPATRDGLKRVNGQGQTE
jgi:hypothetical protein